MTLKAAVIYGSARRERQGIRAVRTSRHSSKFAGDDGVFAAAQSR